MDLFRSAPDVDVIKRALSDRIQLDGDSSLGQLR